MSPTGGGRGGRGKDRGLSSSSGGRSSPKTNHSSSGLKKEYKFSTHGFGKKSQQKATYNQVLDALCTEIVRNYDDGDLIEETLRTEKLATLQMPTKKISQQEDATAKLAEQDAYDEIYKAQIRTFVQREVDLDRNVKRVYGLIFGEYCTNGMQIKLKQSANFDTVIRNNPIELLKKIKNIMNNPTDKCYDFISLAAAMKTLVTTVQKEHESVYDYAGRVKQARDVIKSLLGETFLDSFVEKRESYKRISTTGSATVQQQQQASMKQAAMNELASCVFVMNCDKSRYGSLVSLLATEHSLGDNKYPRTVDDAMNLLSAHRWDRSTSGNSEQNEMKKRNSSDDTENGANDARPESNFNQQQTEVICYCCGETGHTSPNCPEKDNIKKKDWWIHQQSKKIEQEQHFQRAKGDDSVDEEYVQLAGAWNKIYGMQCAQTATFFERNDAVDDKSEQRAMKCDAGSETNPEVAHDTHTTKKTGVSTAYYAEITGVHNEDSDDDLCEVQPTIPRGIAAAGVCWSKSENANCDGGGGSAGASDVT